MNAPLQGIRVVEFGHVAAGPFAGMLLADLGADVVKVEPPDGDHMRRWPPFTELKDGTEFSLNFTSINRGKRSLRVDLKDRAQRDEVLQFLDRADVVVENYRPGVLDRLGLGFEAVSARHPRGVVYCSITGYGQTGPYRDRGAFDVVIQAESGLMSVTGNSAGAPVKCGVPVGDFVAGLYGAYSVLAALQVRARERRSVHVDCPMLSSLLAVGALQTSQYWGTGQAPVPLGSAHPRNAPYQAFEASDEPFVVAAGTDALWRRVADAVGRPELVHDVRYATQRDRAEHQDELADELQQVFATRKAAVWLAELGGRGVPCAPVNTYPEVLADPHIAALGLVQPQPVTGGAGTSTVTFPARFSDTEVPAPRPAPLLGEAQLSDLTLEWAP